MLLTIHYLKRHREADVTTLSNTCQLDPATAKELFSQLESLGAIEHVGFGKGLSYRLTRQAMNRLGSSVAYDRNKRLSKEAIKTRILSVLGERPLHNREIREICDLDRAEVKRLMNELRGEGLVQVDGKGRYAQWHING